MKKSIASIFFTLITTILYIIIFKSILFSDTIIFKFAIHPFNICEKQPTIWYFIKLLFVCSLIITDNIFQ